MQSSPITSLIVMSSPSSQGEPGTSQVPLSVFASGLKLHASSFVQPTTAGRQNECDTSSPKLATPIWNNTAPEESVAK